MLRPKSICRNSDPFSTSFTSNFVKIDATKRIKKLNDLIRLHLIDQVHLIKHFLRNASNLVKSHYPLFSSKNITFSLFCTYVYLLFYNVFFQLLKLQPL